MLFPLFFIEKPIDSQPLPSNQQLTAYLRPLFHQPQSVAQQTQRFIPSPAQLLDIAMRSPMPVPQMLPPLQLPREQIQDRSDRADTETIRKSYTTYEDREERAKIIYQWICNYIQKNKKLPFKHQVKKGLLKKHNLDYSRPQIEYTFKQLQREGKIEVTPGNSRISLVTEDVAAAALTNMSPPVLMSKDGQRKNEAAHTEQALQNNNRPAP